MNALREAEVLGSYTIIDDMVADFNKVTLQDMKDAFAKDMKGAIWMYVGDERVGKAIFQKLFGSLFRAECNGIVKSVEIDLSISLRFVC